MSYIGNVKVGSATHLVGSTLYGTCNTAAGTAEKAVTCANFDELLTGVTIHVKFDNTNTIANPTLNVNNTGAKAIKRYGTTAPSTSVQTSWYAGAVISFTYDGTYWMMDDWTYTADGSDTSQLRSYYSHPTAGGNGIKQYSLFARLEDGTYSSFTTNSGTGDKTFDTTNYFDISKIYYANRSSDLASGSVMGNDQMSQQMNLIDARYTFNDLTTSSGFTANKPVYLVFDLADGNGNGCYKLKSSAPWSHYVAMQTCIYVLIGYAYDTYRISLLINNESFIWFTTAPNGVPFNGYVNAGADAFSTIGKNATVEGLLNCASGDYSHAEGYKTCASGAYSHSEGAETYARVTSSHAEGSATSAYGNYSHTEGERTIANGSHSHSEGYMTTALVAYSHAEGASNFAGGQYSHAEGHNTCALGDSSHAEGYQTYARGDIGNHAEGKNTRATGYASHAEGSDTSANGYYSHAEGFSTIASGYYSHAEGNHTCASGNSSHAEGNHTCASGNSQHVEGKYNVADDNMALIVGGGTSASKKKNIFTVSWDGDVTAGRSNGIENSNKLVTGADIYSAGLTPIDYSTSEQNTGRKWIDGKDIYQITIDFGALPNTASKDVVIKNSDVPVEIDTVIDYDCIIYQQNTINSSFIKLVYHGSSAANDMLAHVAPVSINKHQKYAHIYAFSDRRTWSAYFTIWYTKYEE